MLKSFLDAMKLCLQKENQKNNSECNVDELIEEDKGTGVEIDPSLTNTSLNLISTTEYNLGSKNNEIHFKIANTFGPEEDIYHHAATIVHSPRFPSSTRLIHTSSEKTIDNQNINPFFIPTPSQSATEESHRFIKEKLSQLKENKAHLLFTIKDPQHEEMPEKVFCMNNIVILDSEIEQAKRLTVEDEEGDLLFGQLLVIDASGLVNSLRKRRDGHVFFGPVAEYKNCIINDYIVNYSKETCKTRLFVIFYERNEQKYFIRNINESGDNNLMHIKVIKPLQIKKKYFFTLNQIVFSVDPGKSDDLMKNSSTSSSQSFSQHSFCETLKIVVYNNTNNQISKDNRTVYYFKSSDSPILIGRSKCTITLDYSFLSKKHCSIVFNKDENCWEISDGFSNRPSLNGTWLMVNSKYEINDRTFVKIGNNILKVNIV